MRPQLNTPVFGFSDFKPARKKSSARRSAFGLMVLCLASAPSSIAAGEWPYKDNMTISSGSGLSADFGPRQPIFEKDLHFEQGSIFSWSLIGHESVPDYYGKVVVSGNLTGSDAIFRVESLMPYDGGGQGDVNFWDEEHYWHDIFSDGWNDNGIDRWTWIFGSIESDAPLSEGKFDFRHNALRWSPIPEPTSALAGLLLLGGALRRRRA